MKLNIRQTATALGAIFLAILILGCATVKDTSSGSGSSSGRSEGGRSQGSGRSGGGRGDSGSSRTELGPMYAAGTGQDHLTLAVLRPRGIDLAPEQEKYLDILQGALNRQRYTV